MTKLRLLTRALIGATALSGLALASPASAQRVDRIVAFGDSLADDGNLFQLLPSVPLSAQQTYPTGRFTGGTNYIDTLSTLLGAPVANFAIGGALTNNLNTNGPGLPGFTTQYGSFVTRNTLGGVFPTVSGTFGEGDLVTVSVGGNDARTYQSGNASLGIAPGTLAGAPAAASASVASARVGLDALVGAGAPTVSFLALNTALAPEIAGNASGQAIRTAFANSFNSGIQSVLAGYAANGTIVHYLDASLVLQRIAADPAAFGFTSAGPCPVAQASQCVTDSAFANQFVFYVDGLHPTSRASAVIARYVEAQLQAPLTLQAPSDLALDTARQFGRTLSSRTDLGAPRDGDLAEGLRLFLVGDSLSHDVRADRATDKFDIDSVGVTAGLSYGLGASVVGLAANYSRPRARFIADASESEANSWQVGAFAGAAIAGGFVQGHVGYGWSELEIERRGVDNELETDSDSTHWTAGAKAGWLMPVGIVRLGPVAAIDYARAKVDGYTEDGDSALALTVSGVKASSLVGGIGAELRGDFEGGGVQLRPFASAMLEADLKGDGRTVRFAQTSAPGIVNSWRLEDRSKDPYGRLSAGASAAILDRVSLDALGSATLGRDQGNEVSAHVGLRFAM